MTTEALKVLVIEDNEGDALLMKFYLGESTTHKFVFHHALNMSQAFEKMESLDPDIILMDLNLPDSTGLETIKRFIERFPNKLIIVLTGLVDEKTGLEAVRYGAQDFLVKGKFDSKVLVSSIIFAFERFTLNKRLHNANQDLNKGEERFELLQEMSNTGFMEINFDTNMIFISKFLTRLNGLSNQEISLENFLDSHQNKKLEISEKLELIKSDEKNEGFVHFFNFHLQKDVKAKWLKKNNVVAIVIPQYD